MTCLSPLSPNASVDRPAGYKICSRKTVVEPLMDGVSTSMSILVGAPYGQKRSSRP